MIFILIMDILTFDACAFIFSQYEQICQKYKFYFSIICDLSKTKYIFCLFIF
jgi:hypothetical protein